MFYTVLSGKRLHNYGKSAFLIGKSTISMAIFYSFLYVYQRVDHFLTGKSWISIATVCLLRPGMEGMDFSRTFQRMWGVIYFQRQCLKKLVSRGNTSTWLLNTWIRLYALWVSRSLLSLQWIESFGGLIMGPRPGPRPMAMGGIRNYANMVYPIVI